MDEGKQSLYIGQVEKALIEESGSVVLWRAGIFIVTDHGSLCFYCRMRGNSGETAPL